MTEQDYMFGNVADETELARLRILEQELDPLSHEQLERVGVAPGWRCLDVGAGAGSVTRWLAERVGPSGTVVAADIDLRFLTDLPANVEVRHHNILEDDLEAGGFDVIHCRTVLEHLADPRTALDRMVSALAPGGWLVAIDTDNALFTLAGHPDAALATEVCRAWIAKVGALGIVDPYFGRVLPGLFLEIGLEALGNAATTFITRPGEPDFENHRRLWRNIRPLAISNGMSERDWDRAIAVFDSDTAVLVGTTLIAAWGRKGS